MTLLQLPLRQCSPVLFTLCASVTSMSTYLVGPSLVLVHHVAYSSVYFPLSLPLPLSLPEHTHGLFVKKLDDGSYCLDRVERHEERWRTASPVHYTEVLHGRGRDAAAPHQHLPL